MRRFEAANLWSRRVHWCSIASVSLDRGIGSCRDGGHPIPHGKVSRLGPTVILAAARLGWNIHQNDEYLLPFPVADRISATRPRPARALLCDWVRDRDGSLCVRSASPRRPLRTRREARVALVVGTIPVGIARTAARAQAAPRLPAPSAVVRARTPIDRRRRGSQAAGVLRRRGRGCSPAGARRRRGARRSPRTSRVRSWCASSRLVLLFRRSRGDRVLRRAPRQNRPWTCPGSLFSPLTALQKLLYEVATGFQGSSSV